MKRKVNLKLKDMPTKKPDKKIFRCLSFSFDRRYEAKNKKEINANKSEKTKVFTTLCQFMTKPLKLYKKNKNKDNLASPENL